MKEEPNASADPSPEQVLYARVLELGMYAGLACLLVTFAVYVSGVMDVHVPLEDLPVHWKKDVGTYLHDAQIEPGWTWVTMVGYGDFLNFIGISLLAGVTVLCYVAIIPKLLRNRDYIYAVLAILEVLVLVAAASGMLGGGGH